MRQDDKMGETGETVTLATAPQISIPRPDSVVARERERSRFQRDLTIREGQRTEIILVLSVHSRSPFSPTTNVCNTAVFSPKLLGNHGITFHIKVKECELYNAVSYQGLTLRFHEH